MQNKLSPISIDLVFLVNTHKTAIDIQTGIYDTIASTYKDTTINFTTNKHMDGTCRLVCHIYIPRVGKSEPNVYSVVASAISEYASPIVFNYQGGDCYYPNQIHPNVPMGGYPHWHTMYRGMCGVPPGNPYPMPMSTPFWQQDDSSPETTPQNPNTIVPPFHPDPNEMLGYNKNSYDKPMSE